VQRFLTELHAAGGHGYLVDDPSAAATKVLELVCSRNARRILLGAGKVLARLELTGPLRQAGVEVLAADGRGPESGREAFFAAELGISGVTHIIAETGTVVVAAGPGEPRSLTLLPPFHIAVADTTQLLPDLFDLFDRYNGTANPLPSCLTLITGPSKTGDIELRLVTGVHGPGELHVILLNEQPA
jgi:L-lactate utilization protein LutC